MIVTFELVVLPICAHELETLPVIWYAIVYCVAVVTEVQVSVTVFVVVALQTRLVGVLGVEPAGLALGNKTLLIKLPVLAP